VRTISLDRIVEKRDGGALIVFATFVARKAWATTGTMLLSQSKLLKASYQARNENVEDTAFSGRSTAFQWHQAEGEVTTLISWNAFWIPSWPCTGKSKKREPGSGPRQHQ
jgi:hypothetical protein